MPEPWVHLVLAIALQGGAEVEGDAGSFDLAAGIRLLAAQKFDEAELHFERYLAGRPDDPRGHYYLAEIHCARRDVGLALSAFERAVAQGCTGHFIWRLTERLEPLRSHPGFPAVWHRFLAARVLDRRQRAVMARADLTAREVVVEAMPLSWRSDTDDLASGGAFSPDGARILTEGHQALLLDAFDLEIIAALGPPGPSANSFLAGGERILSFSESALSVTLFDGRSGELVRRIGDDDLFVSTVRSSRDLGTFATGTIDGHVHLWNAEDGRHLAGWRLDPAVVRGVVFGPGDTSLLAWNECESLFLLTGSGKVQKLESAGRPILGAQFHADGEHVLTLLGRREEPYVEWGDRGSLFLHNLPATLRILDPTSGATTDLDSVVCCDPDAAAALCAVGDGVLRLLAVPGGEEVTQFGGGPSTNQFDFQAGHGLRFAAFEVGGTRLAVIHTGDQGATVLHCSTGADITEEWRQSGVPFVYHHTGGLPRRLIDRVRQGGSYLILDGVTRTPLIDLGPNVDKIEPSEDGGYLDVSDDDGNHVLWDLMTGHRVCDLEITLQDDFQDVHVHRDRVVAADDDEGRQSIYLFDRGGRRIGVVRDRTVPIRSFAILRDGRSIALECDDSTRRIVDLDLLATRFLTDGPGLEASPDGGWLALRDGVPSGVSLIDPSTGDRVASVPGHPWSGGSGRGISFPEPIGFNRASAFCADGTWLATMTEALHISSGRRLQLGATYVAFSARGDFVAECAPEGWILIRETASGTIVQKIECGRSGAKLAICPDGRSVVAIDGEGADVVDVRSAQLMRRVNARTAVGEGLPRSGWSWATFRSDGQRLVLLWQADAFGHHGAAVLLDAQGQTVASLAVDLPGLSYPRFNPEGTRFVAAGPTSRLWNAESGDHVADLKGFANFGDQTPFSGDGTKILTVTKSGWVHVWAVDDGREVTSFRAHDGPVHRAVFTADDSRIVSVGGDHAVSIRNATNGRIVALHIPFEDRKSLTVGGSLHYWCSGDVDRHVRVIGDGGSVPLSSYRGILADEAALRRALVGDSVERPVLPRPPQVNVRVDSNDGYVTERRFDLDVAVRDPYGVDRIDVKPGSRKEWSPVPAGRERTEFRGERSVALRIPITIPDDQSALSVGIRVVNVRKVIHEREIAVRYEAPQRRLHLIALGVADYDADVLDLQHPVDDVDAIVTFFRRQEGVFYDEVRVERLVDREVSSSAVDRLRYRLLEAAPEDTIVVFIAGHGTITEAGEYWFLTSAATAEEPYRGIKKSDLIGLVDWERLHARRRVLLIDTCHAGGVDGLRSERGVRPILLETEIEALREPAREGLYVIAATRSGGFARESDGNGLFTNALLEGLQGAADGGGNGFVEIEELRTFAEQRVLEVSRGLQRPVMSTVQGGENFPLARVQREPR